MCNLISCSSTEGSPDPRDSHLKGVWSLLSAFREVSTTNLCLSSSRWGSHRNQSGALHTLYQLITSDDQHPRLGLPESTDLEMFFSEQAQLKPLTQISNPRQALTIRNDRRLLPVCCWKSNKYPRRTYEIDQSLGSRRESSVLAPLTGDARTRLHHQHTNPMNKSLIRFLKTLLYVVEQYVNPAQCF